MMVINCDEHANAYSSMKVHPAFVTVNFSVKQLKRDIIAGMHVKRCKTFVAELVHCLSVHAVMEGLLVVLC